MPELRVMRDGVALGSVALRNDPAASAAARSVLQFDDFLARHDAPSAARIPDGFEVNLDRAFDNGSGNHAAIRLGGPNERLRRSLAESPAFVGHELAHGVEARLAHATRHGSEGWVDVVGQAFAHATGAVDSADWRFAVGFMRDRSTGAPLRDIANPEVRSVGELRRIILGEGGMRAYQRLGDHGFGALVSRPAAIASALVGPSLVGRVYTHAFLHEVGPRMAPAYSLDAAFSRSGTMVDFVEQEARISAGATMAAARELHPQGQVPSRLQAAWRDVGVDVG